MDTSVDVYRQRGGQLADAMRLCRGDSAYAGATALLAVHSSISYNDAVYLLLTGKRHRHENHKAAVSATKRVCSQLGLAVDGIPHLQKLMGHKTAVAYGDKTINDDLAERLCVSAERFEFWAVNLLKSHAE